MARLTSITQRDLVRQRTALIPALLTGLFSLQGGFAPLVRSNKHFDR